MKKFKNKFAVTGKPSLLKAFAEELIALEYKRSSIFGKYQSDCSFIINNFGGQGKEVFGYNQRNNQRIIYNLPQDWDKALKLAAEVEEEIPEYVECINVIIGSEMYWTKGKIYKTENNQLDFPKRLTLKADNKEMANVYDWNNNNNGLNSFKPSTKEAYDKQQEEFKMKELLEEANKRHKKLIEAMYKPEEEPIKIAGYTAKFENGKVSIGCYKDITLKDLKVLKKAIKLANKFSGFEVTEDSIIEGSENKMITLKEIEQLIERLDE